LLSLRKRSPRRGARPSPLVLLVLLLLLVLAALFAAPAGAGELCDGRDGDADGLVDEGCPGRCEDARDGGERVLSEPDAQVDLGRDRVVTWTGTGFAAVWAEGPDFEEQVLLAWTGPSGRPLGDPQPIAPPAEAADDPVVDASESGAGVAWSEGDFGLFRLRFAHVLPDGTVESGPLQLNEQLDEATRPAIVWDGEAFAVAWARYNGTIRLRKVQPDGTTTTGEICVTCGLGSGVGEISVAASPGRLGFGYGDGDGGIRFLVTDGAGVPLGDPVAIPDAEGADHPSVTWTGSRWALVWADRRDLEERIYLAFFDPDGQRIGGDIQVNDDEYESWQPNAAWTGQELLVGWAGGDVPGDAKLYLRRLDGEGVPLAPTLRISTGQSSRMATGLAWSGSRPAMLRDEWDLALERPASLRLFDCCADGDGDGVSRCDGDHDDGSAALRPDAEELCNGVDDDGDGSLDEGCARACPGDALEDRTPLGDQPGAARPGLARDPASGTTFVSREEERGGATGRILRLDRGGPPWDAGDLEADPAPSRGPATVWTGGAALTAFLDERGTERALRVSARDELGDVVTDDRGLGFSASDAPSAEAAWTGQRTALVWRREDPESGDRAALSMLEPGGAPVLAPLDTGPLAPEARPLAVASAGSGEAWIARVEPGAGDERTLLVERRDPHGGVILEPALVAAPAAGVILSRVEMVRAGAGVVVAWDETAPSSEPEARAARVGEGGALVWGPLAVAPAGAASSLRAWVTTGAELVALYADPTAAPGAPLRRARLDPADGSRVAPDEELADLTGAGALRAAWDGAGLPLAWAGEGAPPVLVESARLACAEDAVPLVGGARLPDEQTLTWDAVAGAVYDVVTGDLAVLASQGDLGGAIDACEVSDHPETTLALSERALPRFYLVRAVVDGSAGSYGSGGPGETGDRDGAIASSAAACP
jgi:hypothetical protein